MEMGAGETAFIVPPAAAGGGRAGLRVFTPAGEIPFGGHSVLGATFALDDLDRRDGGRRTFHLGTRGWAVHGRAAGGASGR